MVKKSYNPFYMWGSYLAVAILLILTTIGEKSCTDAGNILCWIPLVFEGLSWGIVKSLAIALGSEKYLVLSPVIFAFFVGWGIHSLARSKQNGS